jgi:hypothetical protein
LEVESDQTETKINLSDETTFSPIAGTYASFTGQVNGMTSDVTITADNIGSAGNITLTGPSGTDINDLITDWNTNNPSNTVTLTAGDGTQIPVNDDIVLTGGTGGSSSTNNNQNNNNNNTVIIGNNTGNNNNTNSNSNSTSGNTPIKGGGLVPDCPAGGCNWNTLMALVNKVVNFILFSLALPIAAIMFAYAGFELLTAGGDVAKMTKAKKIFLNVALGLIIAAAAWLIVHTILTILGYTGLSVGF